jgi:hypothetical protein
VKNAKLQRTFEYKLSKATKYLTLQTDPEVPFEAQKLADVLANFLNIPKQSNEETFPQAPKTTMQISLNRARRIQITFLQTPQKIEVGPRIIVSHLIWKPRK